VVSATRGLKGEKKKLPKKKREGRAQIREFGGKKFTFPVRRSGERKKGVGKPKKGGGEGGWEKVLGGVKEKRRPCPAI